MTDAAGENSAEDREVIRLAKARLARICRLAGPKADQALAQAVAEQKTALVAVAMRVLAASPEDLAAGRVLRVGRVNEPPRPGPRRFNRSNRPPQGKQGKRWRGKKGPGR
jgi:hypothetical protein